MLSSGRRMDSDSPGMKTSSCFFARPMIGNGGQWIARLDAADADYLYVEFTDDAERLPDPGWEYRVAKAHPERFRCLYDDDVCALFQVLKR